MHRFFHLKAKPVSEIIYPFYFSTEHPLGKNQIIIATTLRLTVCVSPQVQIAYVVILKVRNFRKILISFKKKSQHKIGKNSISFCIN